MTDWSATFESSPPPMIEAVARAAFEPDELCAQAAVSMGRDGFEPELFGSGDFCEPLDILCTALESEAELSTLGRWIAHRYLQRLLTVRIQMADHLQRDPGVGDEQIEAPIIILGAPRTGTTRVHALLAQDPSLRAPRGWELLYPLPPPVPGVNESARRRLAQIELGLPQMISNSLSSIHHYDANMYKECLSAMSFSFRSEEFISRYRVPSYAAWLQKCDMTPAYEMHRTVLQVLQRHQPTPRWVLKSPVHLHSLPTVRATYPDAKLVITHRDPAAVIGSVTDLVATLRGSMSSEVNRSEIERYHIDLYSRSLNRLASDLDGVETVAHCRFEDLIADEVGAIESVYAAIGVELSDAARGAMERYAEVHRPDEHGSHTYAASALSDEFAPYLAVYRS